MHVVAIIFFSAALALSLTVVGLMLFTYRGRIAEALVRPLPEAEARPPAEVFYLHPRATPEIEWRRAA